MQTHLKCLWNESQFIRKSEEYWYCSNKLRAVRSTDWQSELFHSTKSTSFVRCSSLNWHRHGQGENNEKTDTVDTISIHSTNIASSILMQWSHEMMFAIVIFKMSSASGGFALRPPLGLHTWTPLGGFHLESWQRWHSHVYPCRSQYFI